MNSKTKALIQELASDGNLAAQYPQYRQAALEILTADEDGIPLADMRNCPVCERTNTITFHPKPVPHWTCYRCLEAFALGTTEDGAHVLSSMPAVIAKL